MKRTLICLLILVSLLLTGCTQAAAPETTATEAAQMTTEAPTEVPTTAEPTEPPCEHQWSEPTYLTPAVCKLCGEEGECKPSFFQEHGLTVSDGPADPSVDQFIVEADGVMYDRKNGNVEPDTICTQIYGWYTKPTRKISHGGFQEITMYTTTHGHAKICANGTVLDQMGFNYGIYDYYTGTWLHPAYEAKNGEDIVSFDLELDGVTYTIEYTNTFTHPESGPWTELDDGSTLIEAWVHDNYTFKVPFAYDGLVLGILPCRDARGINKTENGEFITNLIEEANFEEGIYFRLNGPLDYTFRVN